MSAGWAAALAAITGLAGGATAAIWRGGRRAGKIDKAIELLAEIAADHEARLRAVEKQPQRPGSGRRRT